jgi:signal transduction histidine kinase
LAPALAEAGVDKDRLEAMAEAFDDRSLACGLEWLAGTLDLVGLAGEIETSVGRISHLVGTMKEYTYMDRAVVGEVDVISGLQNTLTILEPRLKDVSLVREYEKDLPRIPGRGGELNEVWTNLIDNAIDAVDGRGTIIVRASSRSSTTDLGYHVRRRSTSSSLSTLPRISGPGPGSGWLSCDASSPITQARSLSGQSLRRHASR